VGVVVVGGGGGGGIRVKSMVVVVGGGGGVAIAWVVSENHIIPRHNISPLTPLLLLLLPLPLPLQECLAAQPSSSSSSQAVVVVEALDVGDYTNPAIAQACQRVYERCGRLDILINNAGESWWW